jgi:hypothetical protein
VHFEAEINLRDSNSTDFCQAIADSRHGLKAIHVARWGDLAYDLITVFPITLRGFLM